ncbi:hypothetical protein TNCV_3602081 [Trichonephila clavipes]|nr:hypothetical protein TNCV_3602081 [Trichonephila clavipes]
MQPTASSAAIQVQVAPSVGAPVSSQNIRRRLAEGHLGSRHLLRVLPRDCNIGAKVQYRYRSLSCGITFQDGDRFNSCQVIYSQFGLAIHQNDHQARRRFVEWAQNEIAVVPKFS